ncbi:beta-N-acetylhexosaminidase [Flindersiella endophytica]
MSLNLLPLPRSLEPTDERYTVEPGRLIALSGPDAGALLFSAQRLQAALRTYAGTGWEISAAPDVSESELGVSLRIVPERVPHEQGYELTVTPTGVLVEAATPQGIFYGVSTLVQLVEQHGATVPCLTAADWPDHAARGVMLDISRDKVPTVETVRALIDLLAGWKVNQVQLYTEHTFAYRDHREVWEHASPFTGEEILELDAYCRERFIELVPNQNAFGHMHRWLTHSRYAHLAEVQGDFETPWGSMSGPFSISPVDPGSLSLVSGLFDELLPHFSSKQLNVGCDETFDLGQGRSKSLVEERGIGRVYLDFLLSLYNDVSERGYTMQYWGDIIEQHPELIPELPKDAVALGWGYEAEHPFAQLGANYAAAGVPFYVCPGTSSWCTIGGRTKNALGNLLNAAEAGLEHGASGYLMTDWGDRGHWQVLPISYLGFAAGAAYSWALSANRSLDLAEAISWHAFRDRTGSYGRMAYDLGNAYLEIDTRQVNSTLFFWILQGVPEGYTGKRFEGVTPEMFDRAEAAIDQALEPLESSASERADADLLRSEFLNSARMMKHACRRGRLLLDAEPEPEAARQELLGDLVEFVEEFRRIWLERNRPGGLDDSVQRFEHLRESYQ